MSGPRSTSTLAADGVRARRRNLELEAQDRARREEGALERRMAETAALAAGRGEALERGGPGRGEARKPMRRITGLQWLLARGRISRLQAEAGERYGGLYAKGRKGDIPSSLKERVGGAAPLEPGEGKVAVLQAMRRADWVLRDGLPDAVGSEMVRLCQAVCGETATVRDAAGGDREAASRMEVQLQMCLDRLAVHFGLARPPRP